MSPGEILFRIKQRIILEVENARFRCNFPTFNRSVPSIAEPDSWLTPPNALIADNAIISKAISILSGHLPVFRMDIDAYDLLYSWNKDPKSGTRAPAVFGKSLDYRNEDLVGDIKYLWEPSRHLHLVTIAQAYALSRKGAFLKGLKLHLRSWLDQCPYPIGPHWGSSLEVAIRLINWSLTWQLIGGSSSDMFADSDGRRLYIDWISSIYRHMRFIAANFSRYSSANNHLIGEAAGLFIASNTWLFKSKKADIWRDTSYRILIEEAQKQVYGDGVSCEQAISYQQFVLDFLILSMLSGKSTGIVFPRAYLQRIEKMLEFCGALLDVKAHIPMIGDADDGYVVQLAADADFCPFRSLLATGAVLFDREDFKAKAGKLDSKTVWLLGDKAVDRFNSIRLGNEAVPVQRSFPEGGYFVMGMDFNTPHEIKSIVDCGPLGYLSIAAHGHADALSFYLSINGNEILIDPGTYAYHSQTRWRNYFRGTSAHNTVRIDGMDQSQISGNFMWASKAEAVCSVFETGDARDHFAGYHDGYRRLKDPVRHERDIKFDKQRLEFKVSDSLNCNARHQVERFFHFSEHCRVELAHDGLNISNKGSLVEIRPMQPGCRIDLYYGDETLPLGWTSRHYDQKTPSYSAVFRDDISGATCLQTSIRIHPNVSK